MIESEAQIFVNLVDECGNARRYGVPKDDTADYSQDGLYVPIAIAAIINSSGQVLVCDRAEGKLYEGYTNLVCGTVYAGESPYDATVREIEEESGIVVPKNELELVCTGVNELMRYRTLFRGNSEDDPDPNRIDNTEVINPRFEYFDTLITQHNDGEIQLMDGFINDVTIAHPHLVRIPAL